MPRPKRYGSDAEKMKAYRERKKSLGSLEKEAVGPNKTDLGMDVVKCPNIPEEDEGFDYKRAFPIVVPEAVEKPDLGHTEVVVRSLPERKLTRVDKLFDAYRPGYFIFGDKVRNVECWECKKSYTTTLEMNRFCSPKCKNDFLDSTFGKKMGRDSR